MPLPPPAELERTCAVLAAALSEGRLATARLVSGPRRSFSRNGSRTSILVPYPPPVADWTRRTLTCGVALQCAPSKDRLAAADLTGLSRKQIQALTLVEGAVARAWVTDHWPGLAAELDRRLNLPAHLHPPAGADPEPSADAMIEHARTLIGAPPPDPLLGVLDADARPRGALGTAARRAYGRMPWSDRRRLSRGRHTVPVSGDGGVIDPNLPPPSRPEDEPPDLHPDRRVGIPYPEWNMWTQRLLPDHVTVLERRPTRPEAALPLDVAAPAHLQHWFRLPTTRRSQGGLEDGSDLDVQRYVDTLVDNRIGAQTDGRIFRDLLPAARDVATALLLDGSSSLGARQGRVFALELACADALSRAMTTARERHGLFVFSGNTRHRVDVLCLKDFRERGGPLPSAAGLQVGGYTRLGAPIRHLTDRLLHEPAPRRLLLVIGDGLVSDEGYEGRYAWADVAHAVEEADEAGVRAYYIGVGTVRVDPLPEIFGPRRSCRIAQVEALPRVLAQVHRELTAA